MHGNANIETRSQIKRRLCRFTKTASVMDHRDEIDTRKARCEKYAAKNKTCGKAATFNLGPSGTERQSFRAAARMFK